MLSSEEKSLPRRHRVTEKRKSFYSVSPWPIKIKPACTYPQTAQYHPHPDTPRSVPQSVQGQTCRHLVKESQSMHHANGDIGGLVFGQQNFLVAIGNQCGAFHHNPVLGTVMVHLQRELGTGLNGNALNLETVAHIDGVIGSPRVVDLAVQFYFCPVFCFQKVNDYFKILYGVVPKNLPCLYINVSDYA